MQTLRARFDGKVLIPEGPVDLPTGQTIELQVIEPAPIGSGPSDAVGKLLQAIHEPPHLTKDDVRALEDSINAAKLPVDPHGPFDHP